MANPHTQFYIMVNFLRFFYLWQHFQSSYLCPYVSFLTENKVDLAKFPSEYLMQHGHDGHEIEHCELVSSNGFKVPQLLDQHIWVHLHILYV